MRSTVRATAAVVVAVLVSLLAPAAAQAAPPAPPFGPAIDGYARYEPQTTCDPTDKPGPVDVRDLLNRTYGTHAAGISRPCAADTSEHYEGRALDYMLSVDNA